MTTLLHISLPNLGVMSSSRALAARVSPRSHLGPTISADCTESIGCSWAMPFTKKSPMVSMRSWFHETVLQATTPRTPSNHKLNDRCEGKLPWINIVDWICKAAAFFCVGLFAWSAMHPGNLPIHCLCMLTNSIKGKLQNIKHADLGWNPQLLSFLSLWPFSPFFLPLPRWVDEPTKLAVLAALCHYAHAFLIFATFSFSFSLCALGTLRFVFLLACFPKPRFHP